jgi:hypothetical protein
MKFIKRTLIIIAVIFLAYCTSDKGVKDNVKRGKVITSNKMDTTQMEDMVKKCNNSDSVFTIGDVYLWDTVTQDTIGGPLLFKPRCFPKSFKPGVSQESDQVEFIILPEPAKYDAVIKGFITTE